MKFQIPDILTEEHRKLHERLGEALQHPGEIGAAARIVAERLHPHFEKEEAFALPPLGLLARLSDGEVTSDMAEVLELTDRLAAELPEMLQEHEEISVALVKLAEIARRDGEPMIAETAESIIAHARTEETLAYPAALLVGRHIARELGQ